MDLLLPLLLLILSIFTLFMVRFRSNSNSVFNDREDYHSVTNTNKGNRFKMRLTNLDLWGHNKELTHNDIHQFHSCHSKSVFDPIRYPIGQFSETTLFSAHPVQLVKSF
jgi:hypothetical protein